MNEQEINNQVEANDFAGELSDEALDRAAAVEGASMQTMGTAASSCG
jgi:hypothetical protein